MHILVVMENSDIRGVTLTPRASAASAPLMSSHSVSSRAQGRNHPSLNAPRFVILPRHVILSRNTQRLGLEKESLYTIEEPRAIASDILRTGL